MSKPVRVRFAPSPTGPLHIGGVRTALFNYLFAKKHGGIFFIRIEDTDQTRFVAEAEDYIFEALEWLGISPDETIGKNEKFGPYRQSERKDIYKKYADQLVNSGWAYYAFDTAEKLDELRKEAEANKNTFIYNHTVRETLDTSLLLSKEETEKRIASGEHYVIRFKTPVNEVLEIEDIIRGTVKFDTNLLDDKVLFKSDGMPTYHLANIVDDHLMETSHVIRGEEWLPSVPLHYLLYKAFNWEAPQFAHLPLILKPVGNGKLSKRDGDKMGFPVFPLEWKTAEGTSMGYRENGFFPEAVINFLALLGWNDGTEQEIFSLEELTEKFDLNRIHKAGAKFDPEKNKWFNHQYLQKQSDEHLADGLEKILKEKNINYNNEYYAYRAILKVNYAITTNNNLIDNLKPYQPIRIKSNYLLSKDYVNEKILNDNDTIHKLIGAEFEETTKLLESDGNYSEKTDAHYLFSRVKLNKDCKIENYKIRSSEIEKYHAEFNFLNENENFYVTSKLLEIVKLVKERANFVTELYELSDYFFEAPTYYDEKVAKNWNEETPALMQKVVVELNRIEDFTSANIETLLKDWMRVNEIGMGKVMQPLRLSLVGALKGPHLFDIIEMIGKEETVRRIEKAIEIL